MSAKWSEYNNYYIRLELTEEGASCFANATRENKGKKINIVLAEHILSSPMIEDEITGGIVIISNHQSYDEMISYFNKLVK